MDNNELYHYGVLGMRWGVRKDPERSRARRIARADSYDYASARYARKAAKNRRRANSGLARLTGFDTYLGLRSDLQSMKSSKYRERAARLRSGVSRELLRAKELTAKSGKFVEKANDIATTPDRYKRMSTDDARSKIISYRDRSYKNFDRAKRLDPNASVNFSVGNSVYEEMTGPKASLDNVWNNVIPNNFEKNYGEPLYKDRSNMKHSGISMRDVMEFSEYLDDCGATLQHAAIRKSRSKYKGGFINGKNTSEYNHDYYIHNQDKWKDNRPHSRKRGEPTSSRLPYARKDAFSVSGTGSYHDPYVYTVHNFNTYYEAVIEAKRRVDAGELRYNKERDTYYGFGPNGRASYARFELSDLGRDSYVNTVGKINGSQYAIGVNGIIRRNSGVKTKKANSGNSSSTNIRRKGHRARDRRVKVYDWDKVKNN